MSAIENQFLDVEIGSDGSLKLSLDAQKQLKSQHVRLQLVAVPNNRLFWQTASPQERLQRFENFLAQTPPAVSLSLAAISREGIYP